MADALIAISPKDTRAQRQLDALLEQEGICRDGNLDYTCGLFDADWKLAATGSCLEIPSAAWRWIGGARGKGCSTRW